MANRNDKTGTTPRLAGHKLLSAVAAAVPHATLGAHPAVLECRLERRQVPVLGHAAQALEQVHERGMKAMAGSKS